MRIRVFVYNHVCAFANCTRTEGNEGDEASSEGEHVRENDGGGRGCLREFHKRQRELVGG